MFTFPDRFAKFIRIVPAPDDTRRTVDGDCWQWVGANSGHPLPSGEPAASGWGYGKVKWQGKLVMAHRAVFTIMTGVNIQGYVLDHLCRRRSCCNPLHLEKTTVLINTMRGEAILFKIAEKKARRESDDCPF